MVFKLYLVNNTQYEYVDLCRSNFSQERCMFMLPENWDNYDDMEVMTEFVFREKLKHRKKYELVDMFPEYDQDESEPNSDEEDLKEDTRKKYVENNEESGEDESGENEENDENDESGESVESDYN